MVETEDLARGFARNMGIAKCESDRIVFIDDDTFLLEPFALEAIARLPKSEIHGYGAKRYWTLVRGWFEDNSEELLANFSAGNIDQLCANSGYRTDILRGGKEVLDKLFLARTFISNFGFVGLDALNLVGGFPENFDGYGYEDLALQLKLFERFGKPVLMDNLRVVHVDHGIQKSDFSKVKSNVAKYQKLHQALGRPDFEPVELFFGKLRKN